MCISSDDDNKDYDNPSLSFESRIVEKSLKETTNSYDTTDINTNTSSDYEMEFNRVMYQNSQIKTTLKRDAKKLLNRLAGVYAIINNVTGAECDIYILGVQ